MDESLFKKNQYFKKSGDIVVKLSTFSAIFSVLTTSVLFTMVFLRGDALSFGRFIAFNAAFSQFFIAVLAMTGMVSNILRIIPTYERVKPILTTEPEISQEGIDPGELTGTIDVSHLNFRYDEKSPLLFDDFSMRIDPGEFVILQGPSGCGKPTLFRLLLGLEKPESGLVMYDQHDLSALNHEDLRRQLGVVLQSSYLMAGSISDNIIGLQSELTLEDAWLAAAWVGLEEDIKALPMGCRH